MTRSEICEQVGHTLSPTTLRGSTDRLCIICGKWSTTPETTEASETDDLLESRRELYGDRKINMDASAMMVEAYMMGVNQRKDPTLKGYDFAMIMNLYKIFRFAVSPTYGDNLNDLKGYTQIVEECIGDDLVAAKSPDEYFAAKKAKEALKFPLHYVVDGATITPDPAKVDRLFKETSVKNIRNLCEIHSALYPYSGRNIRLVEDSRDCVDCQNEVSISD